jgi:hypothetical protein
MSVYKIRIKEMSVYKVEENKIKWNKQEKNRIKWMSVFKIDTLYIPCQIRDFCI